MTRESNGGPHPSPVPAEVAVIAGGDAVERVWRNELGGETFRLRRPGGTRYVKWQRDAGLDAERRADVDLVVESEKLRWASRYVAVPRVIEVGANDDAAWLVTEGIDATSAADPCWRGEPETAVRAIAIGLRRLHDAIPVAQCPYLGTWLGMKTRSAPPADRLVVCHGDPCVPNTLLDEHGDFAAHVDLARLGIADRWADLAVATASIAWKVNFGRSYDDLFFETYGVKPDPERIRIYRALWDAV